MSELALHSHAEHSHAELRTKATAKTRWLLFALLLPFVIATAVGAAVLWPGHRHHTANFGPATEIVSGIISHVVTTQCQADTPNAGTCMNASVRVTSGPDAGHTAAIQLSKGPGQVTLHDGDRITMGRTTDTGPVTYYFADLQRANGLILLGAAFALLVVVVGRLRGLGALVGLAITFAVITQFLIPAVLDGSSPVAVTLVSAAAIILIVLYVAHGVSARTTTAILGTLITLACVGALSSFAVKASQITGFSSEEASYVQAYTQGVSINGLLLGGIILGALGVLNDMSVSQASAVWELYAAEPHASRRGTYRRAMRIGRDHIASTVYTLVLAYTGASLPLLLVFTLSDQRVSTVLTSDLVGEEIVRATVGGLGIILSVPITTAFAVWAVRGQRAARDHESETTPGAEESIGSFASVATDALPAVPADPEAEAREDAASAAAVRAEVAGVSSRALSKKRWWHRKRNLNFDQRPMTRRERKFWEE